MQHAAALRNLITSHLELFQAFSETDWSAKPSLEKWSKKEILGHLIDSALTNLRRFVVTQYAENQHIVYDQDQWVGLQAYHSAATADLLDLWRLLNFQIARVIEAMPAGRLAFCCDTGKNGPELHTMAWLIEDYVSHARHHLQQITGAK